MSVTTLFLVAYTGFHPDSFRLLEQETRIASHGFTARILEDGSVAVQPDGGGEALIVPHDGTVVASRPLQLRLIHQFCVCHSETEAAEKLTELAASDESVQMAEAVALSLGSSSP